MNRRRALLLVSALAACHAEPSRDPSATAPRRHGDAEPAPPVDGGPGTSERDGTTTATDDGASLLDPVGAALDGGPDAAPADGGLDASAPQAHPNTPPPSTSELLRRCRALPKQSDCDDLDARVMCRTAVSEFSREAAARAVSCYEKIDEPCRGCAIKVCTQGALTGFARRGLAACEGVRKKVAEASDAAYGDTMFELCEDYAAGMNPEGVRRFSTCLKRNIGVGVRFCLWDPSVTPCTEGNGPRRPPGDLGL
ncbi:MAG TPA: hypothetical protein VFV94_03160 [Polyangiaceae bacterium]|nr:hypothetical protein [Polyangiaceae bacterium]